MASWNGYVSSIQQLGFSKITIVNRSKLERIFNTEESNDMRLNKEKEDKELLDSWGDKVTFEFYNRLFRIIVREQIDKQEHERLNKLLTVGYIKDYSNDLKSTVVIPEEIGDMIYEYSSNLMHHYRCKYIAGLGINSDTEIIIAYQFKSVWFIVYGIKRKWRYYYGQTNEDGTFNSLRQAWSKISYTFDFLEKAGI